MQTARFDRRGGFLEVVVSCTPKRDGSYRLILYESSRNQIVQEWPGNFINTDDDLYKLPQPNSAHHGRLLEGMIVVAVPPGAGPATVSIAVTQDGNTLASEDALIPPNAAGALAELFIVLEEA